MANDLIPKCMALMLLVVCIPFQLSAQTESDDSPPPAIKPEILFAGHFGNVGDQAFISVQIMGDNIQASGPQNRYAALVRLNPDTTFKTVQVGGKWGKLMQKKVKGKHNWAKASLKGHRVSYGFKQVTSLLQQPYVTIDGKKFIKFTKNDALKSKAPYSPLAADSRATVVAKSPREGYFFIAGTSDGGNSIWSVLPNDPHTQSKMNPRISTNFPNGKSTWCFLYNEKGEQPVPGFRVRGHLNDVLYDPWGRLILWGGGIATHERTKHSLNLSPDGAGMIMIDPDHTRHLFAAAMGSDIYAVAYDAETGIFAVAGSSKMRTDKETKKTSPPFTQVNNHIQKEHGPDKDAMLIVFRMWEPRFSEKRIARIEAWKIKEAEKKAKEAEKKAKDEARKAKKK